MKVQDSEFSGSGDYLEGQGDSVSRFLRGICKVTIWVVGGS